MQSDTKYCLGSCVPYFMLKYYSRWLYVGVSEEDVRRRRGQNDEGTRAQSLGGRDLVMMLVNRIERPC